MGQDENIVCRSRQKRMCYVVFDYLLLTEAQEINPRPNTHHSTFYAHCLFINPHSPIITSHLPFHQPTLTFPYLHSPLLDTHLDFIVTLTFLNTHSPFVIGHLPFITQIHLTSFRTHLSHPTLTFSHPTLIFSHRTPTFLPKFTLHPHSPLAIPCSPVTSHSPLVIPCSPNTHFSPLNHL